MSPSDPDAERVTLGRINGVFGTRGWVKIYSYTRPRERIFEFPHWEIATDSGWRTHVLSASRQQGNGLIALLEGVNDRDEAVKYTNSDIAVARAMLPQNAPGEYYWADLVGLDVVNRDAVMLGRVSRMLETGAHDVLVVAGDRERLIPYVPGVYVDDVDLGAGRISVDWHVDD